MQFADVTNDVAFRKIFGNENHKEVIISFLNAILDFHGKQKIKHVAILNPYQLPKLRGGKVTIVDIKATDERGNTYIIEMQVAAADGLAKRIQYYTFNGYTSQIKRGDFYKKLKPIILIAILDFDFTKSTHYLSRHQIQNVETGERILSDVEFNFIELNKFNLKEHELHTLTEKWIYFIKNADDLEVIPDNVDDIGLKTAYIEASIHTWKPKELEAYDYAAMREQDERGKIEYAQRIGKAEGKEEGKEEERQTRIAKALKQQKLSIEDIADLFGVDTSYVLSVKEQLNS